MPVRLGPMRREIEALREEVTRLRVLNAALVTFSSQEAGQLWAQIAANRAVLDGLAAAVLAHTADAGVHTGRPAKPAIPPLPPLPAGVTPASSSG